MTTKNRIWVLGALTPKMERIEALLRECGERVAYAAPPDTDLSGTPATQGTPVPRVHPGNAYRATQALAPARRPHGECTILASAEHGSWIGDGCSTIYLVECGVDAPGYDPEWEDQSPVCVVRIDHHRPGDPGYGRPPSEFFEASSIGQVVAELARLGRLPEDWKVSAIHASDGYWFDGAAWWMVAGDAEGYAGALGKAWRVPHDLVLTAAADHCLAAAYRGECPGVDPDALMRWRAESRAKFQGRPVEDVLADIEAASEELRYAQPLWCVKIVEHRRVVAAWEYDRVRNGLRPDPDTWYRRRAEALDAVEVPRELEDVLDLRDREVPELPEAAAREGVAYLATVSDRDGRTKVVLGGAASPEMVREFMEQWAPAEGLVDIYGDPARGFAGGYLSEVAK